MYKRHPPLKPPVFGISSCLPFPFSWVASSVKADTVASKKLSVLFGALDFAIYYVVGRQEEPRTDTDPCTSAVVLSAAYRPRWILDAVSLLTPKIVPSRQKQIAFWDRKRREGHIKITQFYKKERAGSALRFPPHFEIPNGRRSGIIFALQTQSLLLRSEIRYIFRCSFFFGAN